MTDRFDRSLDDKSPNDRPLEAAKDDIKDNDNYAGSYDSGGGMPLWESARVAWRGISNNKMRSGLTMLGIVIGVAAVIAMVSMGQAASHSVADQINQLGTNLLIVTEGWGHVRPVQGGSRLTLADSDAIGTHYKRTIKAVAPQVQGSVQIKFGDVETGTDAVGTTSSYGDVNNSGVIEGRFFTDGEVSGRSKVAVVGTSVVSNLLGDDSNIDLVGQQITVNRIPFTVIGILKPKGSGAWGQDQDDTIIMPVATAMRRVFNRPDLNRIGVECVSPEAMDLATEEISNLLRQRHHLIPPFPDDDDFRVHNQSSIMQTSQAVTGTMTSLLAGVAVVSLVVGGIGVMNIMLVSVTERTREIGLRKAVGATSGDILMQFLMEALALALMGGAIGIVLGSGGAIYVAKSMGWTPVVDPSIVLLAAGVSAGVGIVFGLYPAAKAAAQSPINALRYE